MQYRAVTVIVPLLLLGCAVEPSTETGEQLPKVAEEEQVHQTIIRIAPNGTQVVTEQLVSRAVVAEMAEARRRAIAAPKTPQSSGEGLAINKASVVTIDTGCADASSLWMWQNTTDATGCGFIANTMLCLLGTGTVSLSDYPRKEIKCPSCQDHWSCSASQKSWQNCGATWRHWVQSYWPGYSGGSYSGTDGMFIDWDRDSCSCGVTCAFCYKRFYANGSCENGTLPVQRADSLCLGYDC
ncbi:MAG: hypothetical protein IPJ34_11340 [Myxococcales bacterium]|nr:hypothetical protein [Myxococcales bacterium]